MIENEKLRVAAEEFAEKAHKLSSALEIVRNLDEIATIAKYARQMSR